MTPTAPEYSIVIPTYRRREPLARCLRAIDALDYPRDRFELLVVDDGSPTPPTDLLATLDPALDARLICAAHGGPAAARNLGASFARGEYLVFTDDDCAPRVDWLRAIRRAIDIATPPVTIGGRTINDLERDIYATASQGLVDYLYEYFADQRARAQFFTSNNLIVPRAEFLALGGFDVRFQRAAAEDRDLCERWTRHGFALQYASDVVVSHAHRLGFARFNRMHFNYGRGAFDLHRSRARRGQRSLRLEPLTFYTGLVMQPLRHSRSRRGALLAALRLWSQVAYAAGYFFERTGRGWSVDSADQPPRPSSPPLVISRRDLGAPSRNPMSGAV